ncbi:CheR family methyltransferase [Ralstonia solanacearum]|uniref:CheR family methyltransferase n=1 Tax=Ralstonia solanacearum TaxID=305 RepID=UPI003F696F58
MLAEHAKAKRAPFSVWCSASSTGEEPYSIAITLAETFGSMSPGQVNVVASDVDTSALARAWPWRARPAAGNGAARGRTRSGWW